MKIRARGTQWIVVVLSLPLGVGLLTGTAKADVKTVKVDCGKGQTIAKALQGGDERKPLIVVVEGTCNENVTITRDDVTLQAAYPGGATVVGTDPARSTILIQGARRVVIDSLTVSGARNGVTGFEGASFTVQSSTVQGNARAGVVVVSGSSGTVAQSQLVGNGTNGLAVTDNSTGVITGSIVEGNSMTGIFVGRSSSSRIGVTITGASDPNTIRNNGRAGVDVHQSSQAQVHGNLIENHPGSGVRVEGSAATITANTIRGSGSYGVEVVNSSGARIGLMEGQVNAGNLIEGSYQDGIHLVGASSAWLYGNTIRNNGNAAGRYGILAVENSAVRLVGLNQITANGGGGSGGGVFIGRSSSLAAHKGDFTITPNNNDISDNQGFAGIEVGENSVVDLRDGMTVMNNNGHGLFLYHDSRLRIQQTTISGNSGNAIWLLFASSARFREPPSTVDGPIVCSDTESSVTGISLPPGCTGF